MRRKRKRQSLAKRAKRVYSEDGLLKLLVKGYQEVAPYPLWFRYGARRTLSNPRVLWGHVKQHLIRRINVQHQKYFAEQTGTNFIEEDWDNLIIIDACRYDVFDEHVSLPGNLESKTSLGSRSPTFMERNFTGKEYHDTVYVTANSFAAEYDDSVFHDLIELWDEGWDQELQAVPPEYVTERAIEASETYPNKRLLVHYMQPHAPWIGTKGQEFIRTNGLRDENSREPDTETIDTYSAINHDVVNYSREEVLEIYKENLDIVMEHVETLLSEIEGKTVITADHGELLGDRERPIPIRTYGHPKIPVAELRRVPWFTTDTTERRETTSEPPKSTETTDEAVVEERLKSLGYKT